jgi:hypothetical protein
LLSRLCTRRGLRILVSSEKPDWRGDIGKGFAGTRHRVEFGPLTPENMVAHDLVVPLTLADAERVRRCPPEARERALPVPPEPVLQLCEDKYEFNQALCEKGFGQYVPRMANGVDLSPPYILKKRKGEWGQDCYIVGDRDDEGRLIDLVKSPRFFRQEIVPGAVEYATHILFVNNRIVKSLNIQYVFEKEIPIKGQDSRHYRIIRGCAHLELFREILSAIGFQGCVA